MTESNIDDPSTWRKQTPNGVPYRFVSLDGDMEYDSGSVVWSVIIQSTDLQDFLVAMFPPAVVTGFRLIRQRTAFAGLPGLVAQRIQFQSLIDSKPIDPFSLDEDAVEGTYGPLIQANVEFGTREKSSDDDPNNPDNEFTFLDVSADAGGEYLSIPGSDDVLEPGEGEGVFYNEETGEWVAEVGFDNVREGQLPLTLVIPTTMWTVRMSGIPYEYFRDQMIFTVRSMIGMVNSIPMNFLYNAPVETILFLGYRLDQKATWRQGFVDKPPVNVELKFAERRINLPGGGIAGHNHHYVPGTGWKRLLLAGNEPTYQSTELPGLVMGIPIDPV